MTRDLIYRQAAIDALGEEPMVWTDSDYEIAQRNQWNVDKLAIETVPSAEPERLTDDDFETIRIHLNAWKERLCNQRRWKEAEEYQRIIDRFIAFASAEPEQRWILCSERLPEVNGRYLVTRGLNACGSLWNRIYIANYSDLMGLKSERIWWNGNVGKSDFERIDDVIAWRPLPEPWRGEE